MTMRSFVSVTLLGLALVACSRSEPEPTDNGEANLTELGVENETPPMPVPLPAPVVVENAAPPAPAADPVIDEAQVQDDADASGMTARLPPADDSAPAEAP